MFSKEIINKNKDYEVSFLRNYHQTGLFQIRLMYLLSIFLYGIFYILDFWLMPETKNIIFILRFMVVIPIILFFFLLSFNNYYLKIHEFSASLVFIVSSYGILIMISISNNNELGAKLYSTGIILCLIGLYTILRVRFNISIVLGIFINLSYAYTAIFIQDININKKIANAIIANNIFFLTASNILLMFSCYYLENAFRNNYISHMKINFLATHDSLTKIYNRSYFENQLNELFKFKNLNDKLHLAFIDLDHFKYVNDTGGHAAGDAILIEIVNIIKTEVQTSGLIGRLGGDEFGIIFEKIDFDKSLDVCKSICNAVNNFKLSWGNYSFHVSASIGLASINNSIHNTTTFLRYTDQACYEAKKNGRNQVYIQN